jgi:hypothetical protein
MNSGEIAANPERRRIEFTACGPAGKLSREAIRELLLVYASTITIRIFLKAWARLTARGQLEPALGVLLIAGAVILAGVATFLFWRMIRRRDYWAVFLAGALGFVSFFRFDAEPIAAGSALEKPLVLLPLLPAAVAVWAFAAMVRQTDELERRILYQALAFGFAVTFASTLAYSVFEDLGLPRISSFWWWMVLAVSWSAGLTIYSRKYR